MALTPSRPVASGFEKFTRTGIIVNVAQTLEENITLSVGSQAQTVTVQADASAGADGDQRSEHADQRAAGRAALATNGRNIVQLAALGMGVSNSLASFGGINALTSSSGISFNGTRSTHNVYLLDGTELNDRGCGGCYMVLPSQDSIAEFQTLQSNYSPDYGIGSGGTITMVIKSGGRQFHGEVYEYNRNTAYNANDYFNKQAGRTRPEFMLNEPGGNIGGPLYIPHVYNESKTRTFFFWNEEWRRLIQGAAPSLYSTIMANDFPTAGQDLNYTPYVAKPSHSGGAQPAQQCNLHSFGNRAGVDTGKAVPSERQRHLQNSQADDGSQHGGGSELGYVPESEPRQRLPVHCFACATELRPRRRGAHRPCHQQQDAVDGPLCA